MPRGAILSSVHWASVNRDSILDSARTTIAAVIAMVLARLLKMPEYYWAPISTIVIVQSTIPPRTVGWQRFVGTALGAVFGAALATLFRPSAPVYALGIFCCGLLSWLLRVGCRLPIRGDYAEHCFADSAYPSTLDRRLAPLPGGVAGNSGGIGGNTGLAVGEENSLMGLPPLQWGFQAAAFWATIP